jgi:lysophospholipase L1-like esterase
MQPIIMLIIIAFVILALIALITIYPLFKSSRLPKNRPETYLKGPLARGNQEVIVLVGDSLTHGRIGSGYVSMLADELDNERFILINAGVNSHLAWNLSQRLDEIIDCKPSIITVLIGTNDVNASTSEKEGQAYVKNMKLPQMPDQTWFKETLQSVINRLQNETSAAIALLSIPTIGEVPDHSAFKLSLDYRSIVKEVAEITGVTYLPLQEQMVTYLEENPGSPKYPIESSRMQMLFSIFKHYLFGRSWDNIAERSGFRLHTDYLHLNSISARMIADLIKQFIKSAQIF